MGRRWVGERESMRVNESEGEGEGGCREMVRRGGKEGDRKEMSVREREKRREWERVGGKEKKGRGVGGRGGREERWRVQATRAARPAASQTRRAVEEGTRPRPPAILLSFRLHRHRLALLGACSAMSTWTLVWEGG